MSASKAKTTTTTRNGSKSSTEADQISISTRCWLIISSGQVLPKDLTISPPFTITITGTGKTTIKNGTSKVTLNNISDITPKTIYALSNVLPNFADKLSIKAFR